MQTETVGDLIEKLKQFDQGTPIRKSDWERISEVKRDNAPVSPNYRPCILLG